MALCVLTTGSTLAEAPDWSRYDKALGSYVKSGKVDYAGLSKDSDFKAFMKDLRKFDRSKLKTKDEKKAYYINLYNALTLELIIKHMPVSSIKKVGRPWKRKVFRNGGKNLTLDHIEHKILRPMGDYRIHFAINCASRSCPVLRPEAYTASKLNSQLSDQMRIFLADTQRGVKINNGSASVSKIFDWFGEDFGDDAGVLRLIQNRHPQGKTVTKLGSWLNYDWSLNGK